MKSFSLIVAALFAALLVSVTAQASSLAAGIAQQPYSVGDTAVMNVSIESSFPFPIPVQVNRMCNGQPHSTLVMLPAFGSVSGQTAFTIQDTAQSAWNCEAEFGGGVSWFNVSGNLTFAEPLQAGKSKRKQK